VTLQAPQTATEPDPQRSRELVELGIDHSLFVTVFGRCRVEYDGRAASTLAAGDRLVMLKPDGTVLVHTDEGQQPINWQPPGCTQELTDTSILGIRSNRDTPPEELLVEFDSVDHVAVFDATDESELTLQGTESDMRDRILDDPALVEPGFEPRATERETAAGAVDIYGVDEDGNAVVVELKRRRVGPDAISQLRRYVDALERELHAELSVRGILVAPSVTERASDLLTQHNLEFVPLEPES